MHVYILYPWQNLWSPLRPLSPNVRPFKFWWDFVHVTHQGLFAPIFFEKKTNIQPKHQRLGP